MYMHTLVLQQNKMDEKQIESRSNRRRRKIRSRNIRVPKLDDLVKICSLLGNNAETVRSLRQLAKLVSIDDYERKSKSVLCTEISAKYNIFLTNIATLDNINFPEEFCDPITFELLVEPYVASDGHTYNKSTLSSLTRSPFTNLAIEDFIYPNRTLLTIVDKYIIEQGLQLMNPVLQVWNKKNENDTSYTTAMARALRREESYLTEIERLKDESRSRRVMVFAFLFMFLTLIPYVALQVHNRKELEGQVQGFRDTLASLVEIVKEERILRRVYSHLD